MILRGDFVHGGGLFDKSGGSGLRFHANIPLYRTHLGCGSNKDFERRSGRGSAVYYANLLETPAPKTPNAETSIYRQESNEENAALPDPETGMTNPETATSPSANPPYNNDDCLPELPLQVPLPSVQELEQSSESDHEHASSKRMHVSPDCRTNLC